MTQFIKSALINRTVMKFCSQKLTQRSFTTVGTLGSYSLNIWRVFHYDFELTLEPEYMTNLLNEEALRRDNFGVCNTFSSNSSVSGISSVFSLNDLKQNSIGLK